MRFEGRVESELTGSGKPRSWRGTVKLAGLVAYVMATTTGFDFVYVFFVATNPRMSTSTRTLLNALLSQFKSSFLNERWAAKQGERTPRPQITANFTNIPSRSTQRSSWPTRRSVSTTSCSR
jgi:hypothetical protein